MLIDIVVLIIICYFIVIGFRRGIWLSILHFASSIVSLFIASQYYQSIAQRLVVLCHFLKQWRLILSILYLMIICNTDLKSDSIYYNIWYV